MTKACKIDGKMWAVTGSDYCRSHGGIIPKVKAEADIRIAEARRIITEKSSTPASPRQEI